MTLSWWPCHKIVSVTFTFTFYSKLLRDKIVWLAGKSVPQFFAPLRPLSSPLPQANLNKIQRVQNTLARVVTNTSKFEHITPILKKLHWLPIKQRIDYKLCLLTYKTLQIQQPTYLYNCLSFPSHSLSTRSSDSSVLSIPYVQTSLGKRAFSVIAPRLWNSIPPTRHPYVTRYLFLHSAQNSKLIFSIKLASPPPWILSHPIIGLPTRIWFLFFLYF